MTEEFRLLISKAQKKIQVADHMLTMTYKVVNEPKILLKVANNVFEAVYLAMDSILEFERYFKKIPLQPDSFQAKFSTFRTKVVPRLNIRKENVELIRELKEILSEHQESPVEFSRKGKYYIFDEKYKKKELSVEKLKTYIKKSKMFIAEAKVLVSKYDR